MTLATVRIVYILLLRSEKMEDEQSVAFKQAKGMFVKGIASFLIAFAIWNVDKCVPLTIPLPSKLYTEASLLDFPAFCASLSCSRCAQRSATLPLFFSKVRSSNSVLRHQKTVTEPAVRLANEQVMPIGTSELAWHRFSA